MLFVIVYKVVLTFESVDRERRYFSSMTVIVKGREESGMEQSECSGERLTYLRALFLDEK